MYSRLTVPPIPIAQFTLTGVGAKPSFVHLHRALNLAQRLVPVCHLGIGIHTSIGRSARVVLDPRDSPRRTCTASETDGARVYRKGGGQEIADGVLDEGSAAGTVHPGPEMREGSMEAHKS